MFRCISQYISLYSGLQGVQCSHKQKLCDSVVLGILVQKLKEHQLPIDSDATIYHSMEQIRDILAEIKPHEYIFLDKYTDGCCSKPQLCQCRSSSCQKCLKNLCVKCARSYQKSISVNHAACFPFEGLQSDILMIIHKVEGLELARFACKTSKERPAAVWDSLNYT